MWQSIPGARILVVKDSHALMTLHERDGLCRWKLPSGTVEFRGSLEETMACEAMAETKMCIARAVGYLLPPARYH